MARRRSKLLVLLAVAAAAWWWRLFRVRVEGESMSPEIAPGDWLLVIHPRRLVRGSVVVVEHPERPGFDLVKRLAGVPGETVGALTLGSGRYWVIGDRSDGSTDSRWFGPVDRGSIRGVVVVRFRPGARPPVAFRMIPP